MHTTRSLPVTRALLDATVGEAVAEVAEDRAAIVLARASEASVFPLVYRLLDSEDVLTPRLVEKYTERIRRQRIRSALLAEHHRRLAEALADLPYAILKGLPLGERLYGDSSWRATGDIDVLVAPGDVDEAIAQLAAVGFEPEQGAACEPWVNNQFPLYHRGHGLVVEVHWALALPRVASPAVERLLATRAPARLDEGTELWVLEPTMAFLQACYHFHHHVGHLKGLFDVAGWLDAAGERIDFDRLEDVARRLGVWGLVQWPLHALRRLTGLCVGGLDGDIGLAVHAWSRFTASSAHGALASARALPDSGALGLKAADTLKGHAMLWAVASMSLLDHAGAQLKGASAPIFLGPEAMAAKLGKPAPDLETWMRLSARPLELLIKQVREVLGR
jgi:hypothetical protein